MKHVNVLFFALFISFNAFAGNLLKNSTMEVQGDWLLNNLDATVQPTLAWGSATIKPTAGAGNALYVTSTVTNSVSNIAIYQAVTLSADSVYTFDAAYKYAKLENSWCEVYVGATAPATGSDYGVSNGTLVGKISGWDLPTSTDGTIQLNGIKNTFSPATTGTYYFVLKMGVGSWAAGETKMLELSIDELSLTGTKKQTITPLQGGGKLVNGNMEEQGAWLISALNATVNPTIAWGSATIKPTAGAGNALYVTSTVTNATSNGAIYQAVTLSADSTYEFNAAYKYTSIVQSWCEVYIGATAPTTGSDYGESNGTLVGKIGGWNLPTSTDGTYKLNGINNTFKPATTGTYYFVVKAGAMSWDATTVSLELSIDELSLRAQTASALKDITNKHFTVSANNKKIIVSGVQNNISIFSSNGTLVQSNTLNGRFESKIMNEGVYIVAVDGVYQKVLVK